MAASSMHPDDLIARARAYVEASNGHDVARIATMLAEDAAYRSTGVGGHDGAAAILEMNTSFFSANPDVHWEVRDYRTIGNNSVEFDFVISFGDTSAPGIERIHFDDDGQISRVEVER